MQLFLKSCCVFCQKMQFSTIVQLFWGGPNRSKIYGRGTKIDFKDRSDPPTHPPLWSAGPWNTSFFYGFPWANLTNTGYQANLCFNNRGGWWLVEWEVTGLQNPDSSIAPDPTPYTRLHAKIYPLHTLHTIIHTHTHTNIFQAAISLKFYFYFFGKFYFSFFCCKFCLSLFS